MSEYRINKLHGILLEDDRVPQLEEKINKLIDGGGTGENSSVVILKPGDVLNQELITKLSKASQIYYSQPNNLAGEGAETSFPVTIQSLSYQGQAVTLAIIINISGVVISNLDFSGNIVLQVLADDSQLKNIMVTDGEGNILHFSDDVSSIIPTYLSIYDTDTKIVQDDIKLLQHADSLYLPNINTFANTGPVVNDTQQISIYFINGNEISCIALQTGKTFAACIDSATIYTLTPKS